MYYLLLKMKLDEDQNKYREDRTTEGRSIDFGMCSGRSTRRRDALLPVLAAQSSVPNSVDCEHTLALRLSLATALDIA